MAKKVEVATEIQTTPSGIISAFTDPEMLKDWWGVERTLIDKTPGGCYTLAWNISEKGFGFVSTGIIKEYEPERLLIIDNFVYLNPEKPFLGPMRLAIKVEDKGEVAELTLIQDGYQEGEEREWYYQAVKEAWPVVLEDLKNYLEKS